VKVGLFLDLRNPPGWGRPWAQLYRDTLATVEAAERAGIDSVWLSEHHLFGDGYLPQPLTMAAAIAARTSRVRIGTAIVLAALRHPLHLAEQAAVVDVLSGGRLELGLGAGFSPAEYAAFGVDLTRRFRLTDEAFVAVREALANRVTFTGRLDHRFAPAAVSSLDVLVVPSILLEAFGLVAVEGAAAGALPLVARHSGLAEIASALEAEVGRLRDLLEREKLDSRRGEDQVRFQARLLDAVHEAVIATDPSGIVLYWNRFAEGLYGWTAEEAVGRNILELTPAEEVVGDTQAALARLRRGEPWSGEMR